MKNRKPDVLDALRGDAALISLLGGVTSTFLRVYAIKAPYALEFPRLTFTQYAVAAAGFADDRRTESEVFFEIDVFCANAPNSAIMDEADSLMTGLGFMRIDGPDDLYEDLDDTQVYHSILKYSSLESEV